MNNGNNEEPKHIIPITPITPIIPINLIGHHRSLEMEPPGKQKNRQISLTVFGAQDKTRTCTN